MSEEKKVATKKTPVKKAAPKRAEAVVEDVVEKAVSKPKAEAKPEKRVFGADDKVEIMNNTTGRYKYISSRTGFSFELEEYGDVESIPFGELRTMNSSAKKHITEAYVVILDEDAVEELGHTKLYQNLVNSHGIEDLLTNYDKLQEVLPKMPKNMKETVGVLASRKFKNHELHDLRVKAIVEKELKIKIDV